MLRRPVVLVVRAAVAGSLVAGCSGDDGSTTGASASGSSTTVGAAVGAAPLPSAPSTVPPTSATPTTAPSPTAPPAVERDFSAVDVIVGAFVANRGLDGAGLVVVDREDGIVHEGYWGDFDADRVSLVASSSKMITAGVLMKLDEDGLLDIDAPVADAVEWGAGNPDITVAQLVSNSSGLVGLGPDPTYAPYFCQFMPDREIEDCAAEVFATADDDADVVAPDTEFRYGGAQWQVAGAVAEAVSGKTWAELIDEVYVQPCGVDSLGYTNHWFSAGGFGYPDGFDPDALAPTDNPHMEGGAYIDAPDYARLLLMHLRDGECPDGQVLSPASVAELHADRVLAVYGDAGPDNPGYGMGWWVDRDTGRISDGGAYGSMPWLDLDDGYGVYLVVEENGEIGGALAAQLEPIVHEIMTGAG